MRWMKINNVKHMIINVLKQSKGLTLLMVIAIAGNIIFSLVPPQLLKLIVDNYLTLGKRDGLYKMAAIYFSILLFIGLFDFLREGLLTIFGQKLIRVIRGAMISKITKIPGGYFSTNETGTIVSRLINDVDAVSSLFTNGMIGIIIDIFKIIGIILSIWIFSTKLALIVLCILPIIYGITRIFQSRMLIAQIQNRKCIATVNNHISESIKNIQMIHSFHKENYMEEKYKGYLNNTFQSIEKVNFYDSIFSPIILVIRAIVIVAVVILSSDSLHVLGISLGMTAAAIELISNIFSPIETLGMELQGIQEAIAGIRRVDEFLMEPEECEKVNDFSIEQIISNRDKIEVEFKNVTFGYNENNDIIQNISLRIMQKENVTFTGRTGAGKSTLFKLILGTLEPNSGNVLICGTEAAFIPNSEKRKLFGYVEQNFGFIYGTVAEQISMGDESIDTDVIINALKFVGLYDYVEELANGMNTMASETLFSKGQQQLLSIARAIVTNPPILLLDEMTANLDSETEKKIISILQKAGEDRMLISISHRFSKVLKCDRKIKVTNKNIVIEE